MWNSYIGQRSKRYFVWRYITKFLHRKDIDVLNDPLVDRDRILFPPLHIELGLIKQFTKALDKNGDLCRAFPGLTMEKLKVGIFDGPQIRQLIRDPEFENSMNEVELEAWKAFVMVVKNFLGNNKARNYAELFYNMLTTFRNLSCNMSIKMHHLFLHMDRFPENLGSMSDEQGKKFHQDLKEMEKRYQGRWDAVMMADYCWNLKRDLPAAEHSRSSKKRKFTPWSLNNGATCNLHVLTFINAHHSVYSNRYFYLVINICCWQNIFSLKNIFRMIRVDKNQLMMPQNVLILSKDLIFFKSILTW